VEEDGLHFSFSFLFCPSLVVMRGGRGLIPSQLSPKEHDRLMLLTE